MILAKWAGKTLEVSGSKIEGFDALSYYAEAVTEDKEKSDRQYKAFKYAGARTINVTVMLRAALGVDVKKEVDDWMKLLEDGKKSSFYVAGVAISSAEFILTAVRCDQVLIAPNGDWKSADMALEFAQTGSGGSSSGSSSSGSSSSSSGSKKTAASSSKTSSSRSSKTSSSSSSSSGSVIKAAAASIKTAAASTAKNTLNEAAKTIAKNAADAAKRASQTKIKTSSKSSVIMGASLIKQIAMK